MIILDYKDKERTKRVQEEEKYEDGYKSEWGKVKKERGKVQETTGRSY